MNNPVDFDDFTENYNTLLNDKTKFFSSNESYFAKYKIDIVRDQITTPIKHVLEYGCGIGRNIPFLQAAFPNASIVGSDISAASIELARKENPNVHFFQEGSEAYLGDPFDLIFVAGVFHHIPPKERTCAAMTLFERLAVMGNVIIFEHNPYNSLTRRIVNSCPYDADAILVAPAEMKKNLKEVGFKIERQSYCLFVPPRFKGLTSIERHLGWLPLGGQYWIQAMRSK